MRKSMDAKLSDFNRHILKRFNASKRNFESFTQTIFNDITRISEGFFLLNEKGKIIYSSGSLIQKNGKDYLAEYIPSNERKVFEKSLNELLISEKGKNNRLRFSIENKNGERSIDARGFYWHNDGDDEKNIYLFCTDVTEQLARESELKETESRLSTIIKLMADPLIIINQEGIIESVNDATVKVFGWKKTEMKGNNISMLMPQPHRSKHDQYIKTYQKTGIKKGIGKTRELVAVKKNGERFPIELSLSEIITKSKHQYVGVLRDISERKQSEWELKESLQKNKIIADHTFAWESWFDPEGKLLWVNPAVKKYTGYTDKECYEMKDYPEGLIHSDYVKDHRRAFKKMLSEKTKGTEKVLMILKKNGDTLWGSVSWVPVYDKKEFLGFRTSVTDISALQEKEEELKDNVKYLQKINQHNRRVNLELEEAQEELEAEKEKSDMLLRNILPEKVAEELKNKKQSKPQVFSDVTVLFTDFVDFTTKTPHFTPVQLINELNELFTRFDEIMDNNQCERIKTIGDAYLGVCGMPGANENHAQNIINSALEFVDFLTSRNKQKKEPWQIRIGIHSGPVIGGIVGKHKYIYDVFGHTINVSSRMEMMCEPMRVNISETTQKLVKDSYEFIKREATMVKGVGEMSMYFVKGKK